MGPMDQKANVVAFEPKRATLRQATLRLKLSNRKGAKTSARGTNAESSAKGAERSRKSSRIF